MGNEQSGALPGISFGGGPPGHEPEFVANHFQRTREFAKSELAAHWRAVRSSQPADRFPGGSACTLAVEHSTAGPAAEAPCGVEADTLADRTVRRSLECRGVNAAAATTAASACGNSADAPSTGLPGYTEPSDAAGAAKFCDVAASVPQLSDEILLHICSFVNDPRTLCALAGVCKRFCRVTSDLLLWRALSRRHWQLDADAAPADECAQLLVPGAGCSPRPAPPLHPLAWKRDYKWRYRLQRAWLTGTNAVTALQGHAGSVTCLHYNDSTLISGDDTGVIQVWNIRCGERQHPFNGHSGAVWSVRFDHRHLVSGSYDRTVIVWDMQSWQPVHTLRGHSGWVSSVALVGGGGRVLSASWDGTMCLWDISSGAKLAVLNGECGSVNAVHCEPDDPMAVAGTGNSLVQLWDTALGQPISAFTGHSACVYGVHRSGSLVVSGSDDKTVRLWDVRQPQAAVAVLRGHRAGVMAVQTQQWRVASGSYDHCVALWDTRRVSGDVTADAGTAGTDTGATPHPAYLYSLYGHGEPVFCLQMDERKIVTGSADRTIKIFDFTREKHRAADRDVPLSGLVVNGKPTARQYLHRSDLDISG